MNKYLVEQHIVNDINRSCRGMAYLFYTDIFDDLMCRMSIRIGCSSFKENYHNLKFIMNRPLYHEFCFACDGIYQRINMYKSIPILRNPINTQSPDGIVRLIYEEPETEINPDWRQYCIDDAKVAYEFFSYFDRGHGFQRVPHIDHVIFNGPATIVFWKDGTKTVVKHDGKGRKDKRLTILYAFIRKIYGEGKPYHYILNEIEETIKKESEVE